MTARTHQLRAVAERIASALPPVVEEVVLTGSVSRGVADDLSDIEMLVVTTGPLGLADWRTLWRWRRKGRIPTARDGGWPR